MHEGESYYLLTRWDAIYSLILIGVVLALIYTGKFPTVASIRDFVEIVNTRGGNILLLAFFTWIFFRAAMLFIYHVMALADSPGDTVPKSDAIITAGLGFVTGGAFQGAFSSLLKTMNPLPPTPTNGQDNPTPNPPPEAPKA
jgi:hypothetical protein